MVAIGRIMRRIRERKFAMTFCGFGGELAIGHGLWRRYDGVVYVDYQ